MNARRILLRIALAISLALQFVAVAAGPAGAATAYSGTSNCGSRYVQIDLTGATGSLSVSSLLHLDYGASGYTTHLNYEIGALYTGYVARTRMHIVRWSTYLIGSGRFPKPTVACIDAPKRYNSYVRKSGFKNCGSHRVAIVFRGYAFEADVDWNYGPTTRGHRMYGPVLLRRYVFPTHTGEHAVYWSMTARGVMPGTNINPTFDGDRISCY